MLTIKRSVPSLRSSVLSQVFHWLSIFCNLFFFSTFPSLHLFLILNLPFNLSFVQSIFQSRNQFHSIETFCSINISVHRFISFHQYIYFIFLSLYQYFIQIRFIFLSFNISVRFDATIVVKICSPWVWTRTAAVVLPKAGPRIFLSCRRLSLPPLRVPRLRLLQQQRRLRQDWNCSPTRFLTMTFRLSPSIGTLENCFNERF